MSNVLQARVAEMAATQALYDAKRIERDKRIAAVRQNKLNEMQNELDGLFVSDGHGPSSNAFQASLFECLLFMAEEAGTTDEPREWALDLFAALMYGEDISFVPKMNKTTKHHVTVHDFKGHKKDGTAVPFHHYLNSLIKGKIRNRNEAQRKHNQRHLQIRENPEELGPGMITIDHAIEHHGIILDDGNELPPLYRIVKDVRDLKLQDQLRGFAELAFENGILGKLRLTEAEKTVFRMFLIGDEGNKSEIARETGIDRRRVDFLLNEYMTLKLAITRCRVLEKGMEDSMKSIQYLLGWRNPTGQNPKECSNEQAVEEFESELDPENPGDGGWVGYKLPSGQYDEMAPNPDWHGLE
jgi:hypothetical protein